MNKWRIKKGEMVQVITGSEKGKTGEILLVEREKRRVVVKGVNICVRHKKPSMADAGGIIKKEKSIHASNVMLIDSSDEKPTRVAMKMIENKKVRVSRRTGTVI
jgi:large subunit ribosomal protein L24